MRPRCAPEGALGRSRRALIRPSKEASMGAREFPRLEIEEALARLESMSFFMTAVIEGASRDELLFSPGNRGEFSLTEQACHLRDLEREGYLVRARRMLSETTPQLS